MDPEEVELLNDYRYRSYSSVIDKALRNFESSSEWADLISSLGKLNKALQSNLKYSLLPKRLIICKRLAQCLHPALPGGVHLKALETYEIIFKIIGTKWLAKDLFIYSSGLFPLLANAAMSVKPVLLGLYERYYLPLQRALLPSLQAFVTGLLPGLEEGSEIYERTDALMVKLSLIMGQEVFYGALWGSVLISPLVRLPASLFIVCHVNKVQSGKQQSYVMGTDHKLTIKSMCVALLDSNILVQRNLLEIILFFFPFYTCLMTKPELISVLSAAAQTLLRRDMSLNRRLYSWLLGLHVKGLVLPQDPSVSTPDEDYAMYYFGTYSKNLLVQSLIKILQQQNSDSDLEQGPLVYLKPFRILMCLLDKPEIGNFSEKFCFLTSKKKTTEDLRRRIPSAWHASRHSQIKESKGASEIVKTVNLLIGSLSTDYLWDYMTRCFEECLSRSKSVETNTEDIINRSNPPSVSELCTLLLFLLDVIPLPTNECKTVCVELYSEVQTQYLPQMLSHMVQSLLEHMDSVSLPELTHALKTCFKVLSKIQMPAAYIDSEQGTESAAELTEDSTVIIGVNHLVCGGVRGSGPNPNHKRRSEEKMVAFMKAWDDLPACLFSPSPEGDSPVTVENGETASDTEPRDEEGGDATFPPLKTENFSIAKVSPDKDDVWTRGGSMQKTMQCIQELLASFTNRHVFGTPFQVQVRQGESSSLSWGRNGGDKKDEKSSKLKASKKTWQAFAAICQLLLDCATFPVYFSEEETEQLYSTVFLEFGGGDSSLPTWLKSLMTLCCCVIDCHIQNVAISTLLEMVNHSQSLALVIEDRRKRLKTAGYSPFFGRLQMITVPVIPPSLLKLIAEKTGFYQRIALVLWNQLNKDTREHHITCVELFYKLHCLAPSANICEDIICDALLHRDKGTRLEALFRFSVLWHLTREIQGNRTTSHNRSFDRSLFAVLDSLNCSDGAIGAAAQGWLVRALSLNDVVRILEPVLLLLLHPNTQRTSIQCLKQQFTPVRSGVETGEHGRALLMVAGITGAWRTIEKCSREPLVTWDPSSGSSLNLTSFDSNVTLVLYLVSDDMRFLYLRKRAYFRDPAVSFELSESSSEENFPTSQFATVDREALWLEVEGDPEKLHLGKEFSPPTDSSQSEEHPHYPKDNRDNSEHTESADTSTGNATTENTSSVSPAFPEHHTFNSSVEEDGSNLEDKGLENNGNTPDVPINTGAKSKMSLNLVRADSERTQASETLSSDDEIDLEFQSMTSLKLIKQQKEKQEMISALFKHVLLYLQLYDSKKVLYAFSVLEAILKTNPKEFIEAVAATSMDTSSTAHLNLICNLLTRHQEVLIGHSFYGTLQAPSPSVCPHSLLIELLTYLCLSFLRSYYPYHLKLGHKDLLGNRDVQVKSVEVLIRMMSQLVAVAKVSDGKNVNFINLLTRCKVQEFVLLSLCGSMYACQKRYEFIVADKNDTAEEETSEENLINFGQDQIWSEHPLQIKLLKLLQVMIVLEHHLGQKTGEPEGFVNLTKEWQRNLLFQQSINAMLYVQDHPITSQGMFVSAVIKALQPQYGYGMHPPWVSFVTSCLPYFGKSLGWTVAPFIVQICANLDDLVKQYEFYQVSISICSVTSKTENISPDYPLTFLEGLTTITHFCLLDGPLQTKKSFTAVDPANLRNAKNAILEELPRIMNTLSLIWGVIRKEETQRRPSDLLGATKGSSSVYFKATKNISTIEVVSSLLSCTVTLNIPILYKITFFFNSSTQNTNYIKINILPVASEAQLTLVALVQALNTLKTDTILQLLKEVIKKPPQIKGEEKTALVDIPMLQFTLAFIQRLPSATLQENLPSLLSLLKESVQLNLSPPGHFLLLGILNDFVTRTPNLENKKDQRDLQEVTQKMLEAMGNIAGSSLEQTSWLSRNLEVKVQPQVSVDEADPDTSVCNDTSTVPSSMVSASAPSVYSVQALTLLAEVLAPLLDMVYRSDEKDKAVPLISRLLYYVFPYLKNHSAYNVPSFRAGAELLSSLSGYAYTKRAWKKEVLELFLDPVFFHMDSSCVSHWRFIVDHLLTHEKTMFKDLIMSLTSMQSSSLKLFANYEQKAMLLKRQAFAIFSGELDQYHLYLPLIQERLTENLRVGQTSVVAAQMFLTFRVLLLRISPQHLTSLWPIMVTELIQVFMQLEEDLAEEEEASKNSSKLSKQKAATANGNGPLLCDIHQNDLGLYLAACKFLDFALSFPPEKMSLFQMYRWAFVPEVDTEASEPYSAPLEIIESHQECKPYVVRVMELLNRRFGETNSTSTPAPLQKSEFPMLTLHSITCITQLMPFFRTLISIFKTRHKSSQSALPTSHSEPFLAVEYPVVDSIGVSRRLEENVEFDFLEYMDN
uniref:DOP1 leucine zipper like protein B n=1 Tax=Latimeria chalumnae TaxID=7897 RepID=H3AEA4_LATCH